MNFFFWQHAIKETLGVVDTRKSTQNMNREPYVGMLLEPVEQGMYIGRYWSCENCIRHESVMELVRKAQIWPDR